MSRAQGEILRFAEDRSSQGSDPPIPSRDKFRPVSRSLNRPRPCNTACPVRTALHERMFRAHSLHASGCPTRLELAYNIDVQAGIQHDGSCTYPDGSSFHHRAEQAGRQRTNLSANSGGHQARVGKCDGMIEQDNVLPLTRYKLPLIGTFLGIRRVILRGEAVLRKRGFADVVELGYIVVQDDLYSV